MARSALLLAQEAPASALQAEFAAVLVRESAIVEAERIQAVIDGVTLAGEQVQDVRLKLLENGPEVSTSMMVLDLFVFFALESTIAGKVLSAVTKGLLNRVLRSRAALELLPKSPYGRELRDLARSTWDRKVADQILSAQ